MALAGCRHSGRGSTHCPPLTSPFTRWLRLSPFPAQNFIEFPPSEQRKVRARVCGVFAEPPGEHGRGGHGEQHAPGCAFRYMVC